MEGAVSGRAALRLIEEQFRFLVEKHGFALTQSAEVPAMAWYGSGDRSIVISYDVSFETPFKVALEDGSSGSRYDLWRLASMRDVASPEPVRGPLDVAGLAAACSQARTFLEAFCSPFLTGEPDSFRRASRESVLVEKCRELARSAYFDGDYKLAMRLFDALRDYWDERDRETFELARRGETPLTKGLKR